MRKYVYFTGITILILVLAAVMFWFYNLPVKQTKQGSYFVVRGGESLNRIATNLKKEGFVRSRWFFYFLGKISGSERSLKSGEYYIEPWMKSTDILSSLSRGEVITVKFTIPEGYTMKQIAALLDAKGIVTEDAFLEACRNSELLSRYGIPFDSVEGFLFPDTYIIAKNLSALQIVEVLIRNFFYNLEKIPFTGYSPEELKKIVIIASMVEKEARLDSERPLIAAVFYNRLKRGKRLESCATVQYILGKTKERLLYSDLKISSPYNTYLHQGLPPGPISNPGFKSLDAAVNPSNVDYLFFVSRKDGSHHFSNTYTEHLKAIRRYNRSGGIAHQIS